MPVRNPAFYDLRRLYSDEDIESLVRQYKEICTAKEESAKYYGERGIRPIWDHENSREAEEEKRDFEQKHPQLVDIINSNKGPVKDPR
ncbi:hypothetical protein IAE57_14705 [Stenotrophomonas sp. S48]|uniref:hypothetical protein n=1 Tax=unclassified Stenotrophomonas TaxID=196198 RepID=UPI00190102D8|nr:MULTISPECIES: hypothetical protein [unclassified Stenotrophomonas]MBK0027419.1 hypothetical protein [Stenotrophomonas sp. S48]MBK0048969.1 hypothetical protein [Stenotrophomonas sp. S49]